MNWHIYDPDEYEQVITSYRCLAHEADPTANNPDCSCHISVEQRRRPDEDIAARKAERLRLHEDAILAQAEAIKAKRAMHQKQIATDLPSDAN